MRRLIKLALIALGIRALWRWYRRRQAASTATTAPTTGDPADELRRKLAASRDEPEPEPVVEPETTVEERRSEVHEHARATLDEMTSSGEE